MHPPSGDNHVNQEKQRRKAVRGPKGSGKRKNNKERGNTQKNDNRQQRPRTVARLNIVAPVQWALVFMAQMMAFPALKKGAAMVASTVDDIISLMTTLPMHESDPNLAIDTFRELKEKNQTDAYGRGFTSRRIQVVSGASILPPNASD